jgi:hypothetical protein
MAMSFVVLGDLQEQYELEIRNESIKLFFTQTKCFADAIPGIVARSSWARGGKKNLCMCGCDDYGF